VGYRVTQQQHTGASVPVFISCFHHHWIKVLPRGTWTRN
jgi:hypothetical protein